MDTIAGGNSYMKKVLALFLALAALLAMTACKRSEVTQVGQTLDNWANPPKPTEQPEPIDIKQYQDANFAQDLGLDVVSLPNASVYIPNKFFVLEEWYGQIEFTTTDNLSLNVRVAEAGGKRLTTTYAESHIHNKETYEIDGIEVKVATAEEGCALVTWERGGVQYAVHSNRRQGVPPMQAIEDMVRGLDSVIVGASGEAESG